MANSPGYTAVRTARELTQPSQSARALKQGPKDEAFQRLLGQPAETLSDALALLAREDATRAAAARMGAQAAGSASGSYAKRKKAP